MNNIFEPLDDDELIWLDDFLLERIDRDADFMGKDEGVLSVAELDGLMTAVVSGPVMMQPSRWVPQVWGDFPPAWQDEQQLQMIMSLFMRHMNSIATLLMEQPCDFEPMFEECIVKGETHTIVDEWCEGYMRGVALALSPLVNSRFSCALIQKTRIRTIILSVVSEGCWATVKLSES